MGAKNSSAQKSLTNRIVFKKYLHKSKHWKSLYLKVFSKLDTLDQIAGFYSIASQLDTDTYCEAIIFLQAQGIPFSHLDRLALTEAEETFDIEESLRIGSSSYLSKISIKLESYFPPPIIQIIMDSLLICNNETTTFILDGFHLNIKKEVLRDLYNSKVTYPIFQNMDISKLIKETEEIHNMKFREFDRVRLELWQLNEIGREKDGLILDHLFTSKDVAKMIDNMTS